MVNGYISKLKSLPCKQRVPLFQRCGLFTIIYLFECIAFVHSYLLYKSSHTVSKQLLLNMHIFQGSVGVMDVF